MQQPRGGTVGFFRAFSSLWFGAVLLVLVLFALACATLYESTYGTEQALHVFYGSRWFQGLLTLLGLSVLTAVVSRFPFTRAKIGFLVTHGSLLLILGGAAASRIFGVDGELALMEGEGADRVRRSGREQLTMTNAASGASTSMALGSSIFGGLNFAEEPEGTDLALDGVSLRIARYLPDSVASTAVVNDAPVSRTAVEISLSASGVDDPIWVFEGERQATGKVTVALTNLADAVELEKRLNPDLAAGTMPIGVLKVTIANTDYELPVEACMDRPMPVGETGYTVRVLEYFPHATVASGGGLVNASSQPVNPAIRAEIVGPSGTQTKLAFARFPDFTSSHGGAEKDDLKLTFIATTASDKSPALIEVFAAPDGEMRVRFPAGSAPTTHTIHIGESVDTPWTGMKFAVLRKYDHARLMQELATPPKIREQRVPAVLLGVNADGVNMDVWLQKSEPKAVTIAGASYEIAYADQKIPLGFRIALNKFTVGYYPGGWRPRSFESQVTITDPGTGRTFNRIISMNHPTSCGGYTFYQSSYELSGQRALSVLSVARDPGKSIVFAGYIGVLGGMCWVLITRLRAHGRTVRNQDTLNHAGRNGSRRINLLGPADRCLTHVHNGATAPRRPPVESGASLAHEKRSRRKAVHRLMLLPPLCASTWPAAARDLPDSLDVTAVRSVCVQHDGRYMPLDTLARDVVQAVTGEVSFGDRDPVLWLLAWTFEPEPWMNEPLITIRNIELRREIGLPLDQTLFSYSELTVHQRLLSLIKDLSRLESGRKMNPLESKVSGIHDKLIQLQTVFRGQTIRLIPDAGDPLGVWKTSGGGGDKTRVDLAWRALQGPFLADDASAFADASEQLLQATAALPAAFRPPATLLSAELRYNNLAPFSAAWRIMLMGTVVSAIALLVRRRWFDVLAFVALLGGFAVLTYGLLLRWQIAGRIPASNMFESLLFLSWGAGAFAIISVPLFRQRLVPLSASAMSSLALLLADRLPIDQFIRPIAPVLLDTIWMSIHVPIIMVSYSVLALAVLVAHIQLVVMAVGPKRAAVADTIDGLHYWYVHVGSILLTAGIITGSMWAASSWGRYWGWDPKEVWSLVALLGYLTILHVRIEHEHVPRWVYALAGLLVVTMLAVVVPKLAPLSSGRLFGLAAAMAGMGFMVLARGPFATATKSIICFWLIVMTYVGVNYVLGMGLHSYGFGAGAVARSMFLTGAVDLGFVALCALAYVLRHRTAFRVDRSIAFAAP